MGLWVDEQVARNIERLDLPFNEFGIDPYGISKEALKRWYTPWARLYRHYSKVTSFGLENIPQTGRALLIGNHSGGIGVDAAMSTTATILNDDCPRLAHGMAEYFFQNFPFVSPLMYRIGALPGLPEHAEQLMDEGRLVMAFPEGARGAGKLYKDRYKLTRFGTGFMRLALRKKAPIVPFAFVGGEEAFPILFKIKWLAKLIGAPIVPIAPQLIMWPLPVSCQIYFGEPMTFEGSGNEPDEVVIGYVDQVKDAIARLIERGLKARPSPFTTQRIESA